MSLMSLEREALARILENVANTKIGVVGDYYLDRYSLGIMGGDLPARRPSPSSGSSPRTPPRYLPGAAGNVALNLADLGAQVHAVGMVGNDTNGQVLLDILEQRGVNTSGMVRCERPPHRGL